eukprot:GHRR01029921.1.p1 GENE.GHRR01029921.1~~GHRR01029921.1.p1  ORF type:complete len:132 (-),score=34.03 GHRR01029921.1:19-414(-)
MVEKLCTPSDDEHNEHKRLQLRELAALNGTLKDLETCFVCGEDGHDAEHCPKKVSTKRQKSVQGCSGGTGLRLALAAHQQACLCAARLFAGGHCVACHQSAGLGVTVVRHVGMFPCLISIRIPLPDCLCPY